jgi:hypothetical protein
MLTRSVRILVAALTILPIVAGPATAQPGPAPGGGPPGLPAPPRSAPRPYVPYDPAKEPAFRGEEQLRKGADSLRSGDSPFPRLVKQVGPGLYELGTITLDVNARVVKVPGRINMTQGIIEYFAVMEGRGKLHESVLALDVQPSLLQLGLILLGLEPGELAPGDVATRTPPRLARWGDPVMLWVEWEQGGKVERIAADQLVWNRETQKPMEGNRWHFTGSFFGRDRFAADVTGSIVATWLDFRAMLNTSVQVENPYRASRAGYEVNTKLAPPLDTPVRLLIEPADRDTRKAPAR